MVMELTESQRAIALPYCALLAVVALQRIGELVWSRRNLGRVTSSAKPQPDSATTWSGLVLVHAALVVLPALEFLFFATATSPRVARAAFVLGCVPFLLAQALRYWAITSLGRTWNVRAIVDPSIPVVTRGPYRWIRHPNYLAVLMEFTAVPLAGCAWRSWIVLQLVHTPLLVARIRAEERSLSAMSGYREAMEHKGRILPRLFTRAGSRSR